MTRLVLRRPVEAVAGDASVSDAEQVVAACDGCVIHRGDRTLLVDVAPHLDLATLRDQLSGWVVSEEGGPRVQIPDTRLKLP